MIDKKIKHYFQKGPSCGPTSLRMIASKKYKYKNLHFFEDICQMKNFGTDVYSLSNGAMLLGFKSVLYQNAKWKDLLKYFEQGYSIIVLYSYSGIIGHYSTVKKINGNYIFLLDPLSGIKKYKIEDFIKIWKVEQKGYETGYHNFLAIKD